MSDGISVVHAAWVFVIRGGTVVARSSLVAPHDHCRSVSQQNAARGGIAVRGKPLGPRLGSGRPAFIQSKRPANDGRKVAALSLRPQNVIPKGNEENGEQQARGNKSELRKSIDCRWKIYRRIRTRSSVMYREHVVEKSLQGSEEQRVDTDGRLPGMVGGKGTLHSYHVNGDGHCCQEDRQLEGKLPQLHGIL